MKFFHLSDLHIGKQLHYYNLKEDQRVMLREIVSLVGELRPDAIVLAGDIYDKPVPSAEAVAILDEFLTNLSAITPSIPVLIISGNHDSAERLRYAAQILRRQKIYVAGMVPSQEGETLEKVTLSDAYGEVDFYLLPFLKPSYTRKLFPENVPTSYHEAVKRIIEREQIDYQSRRNVLVSHQFYTGNEAPARCDSETISAGGLDNVDTEAVRAFDYVALGHLHGKQSVGADYIRYCGTMLKYSVSEAAHEKCLTVVTMEEKHTPVKIEEVPLHPLREVRKKRGCLKDLMEEAKKEERDDYISITLTDETEPYQPREQLGQVYNHILEIRIDNSRTRRQLEQFEEKIKLRSPIEAFGDFYLEMQGRRMNEEETGMIQEIFTEIEEDDHAAT